MGTASFLDQNPCTYDDYKPLRVFMVPASFEESFAGFCHFTYLVLSDSQGEIEKKQDKRAKGSASWTGESFTFKSRKHKSIHPASFSCLETGFPSSKAQKAIFSTP